MLNEVRGGSRRLTGVGGWSRRREVAGGDEAGLQKEAR
jgi:hypothetical protein